MYTIHRAVYGKLHRLVMKVVPNRATAQQYRSGSVGGAIVCFQEDESYIGYMIDMCMAKI